MAHGTRTVIIALVANLLVAIAKSGAAIVTGSASMFAEAAHSWADTGNQVFLLVADRRSRRPADAEHPFGHGREAYVWSMFAAIGLFAVGAIAAIQHGVQQLLEPAASETGNVTLAYVVLGVAALLEGTSFVQAVVQARSGARRMRRRFGVHVLNTSDPTLRAVFFEDAAALLGLAIAALGVFIGHRTGSTVPDAIGSILVGVLLAAVAFILIDRNRRFLVGEVADLPIRTRILDELRNAPEVAEVGFLRLEYVGPAEMVLIASVDIVGELRESALARTLDQLETRLEAEPGVRVALLTLLKASTQLESADTSRAR